MKLSELRDSVTFHDTISRVIRDKERVTITKYGKPVFVIVPIEDYRTLLAIDNDENWQSEMAKEEQFQTE